jgi:hypothetical protein
MNRRKFNILDLITLVAFTAVGIASCLAIERVLHDPQLGAAPPPPALRHSDFLPFRVHEYCRYSELLLLAWGMAFLLLRLRSPRPRIRRLCRSPATAACITVFVVMLVQLMEDVVAWALNVVRPLEGIEVDWRLFLEDLAGLSSAAVPATIASWVVIALSGKVKFGRDWVEVYGSLIALGWLLLLLEAPVCSFLWSV